MAMLAHVTHDKDPPELFGSGWLITPGEILASSSIVLRPGTGTQLITQTGCLNVRDRFKIRPVMLGAIILGHKEDSTI